MNPHVPDPPPYPETGDDTGFGPNATSRQLWTKVVLIVVIVVFVVLVGLHLAGGGVQH